MHIVDLYRCPGIRDKIWKHESGLFSITLRVKLSGTLNFTGFDSFPKSYMSGTSDLIPGY